MSLPVKLVRGVEEIEIGINSSPLTVSLGESNSFQSDAFNRLRVSNPSSVFDCQLQYGLQPLLWETILTGSGTATAIANNSSVGLTVSTNGDSVVRQTHRYFRYQTGRSQMILLTGVIGAIKAGIRQRLGYFDAQNGVFFEQNGSNLRVVQRSFTSGVAVDSAVNQSDWNTDKLDGSGVSGVTLDTSKAQIFTIDLQWLGVGRVRFGFNIDGVFVPCHYMLNANAIPSPYMTTANLPLRYEISMTSATTPTTLIQICQSVANEGGMDDERGLLFTINNTSTPISVSTRRPLLSIRPKLTFNSIVNRANIIPISYGVRAVTNDVLVELVYNGTLTGGTFASVNNNSTVEGDVAASAISGGTPLSCFYSSASAKDVSNFSSQDQLLGKIITLTLDNTGSVQDVLSIVATGIGGTASCLGAMNWKEIY